MSQIRVLIAMRTLVPVVAEIVRVALASQPDIALRTTDAESNLLESGDLLGAIDALVMGAGPDVTALPYRLAWAHPDVAVLAISADGRDAHLLALRPHLTRLEMVSPSDILAAIRAVATDAITWRAQAREWRLAT